MTFKMQEYLNASGIIIAGFIVGSLMLALRPDFVLNWKIIAGSIVGCIVCIGSITWLLHPFSKD